MQRGSGARFAFPFVLGTIVGSLGGIILGAVVGHRVISAVVHLTSLLTRDDDDQLRFDLLAQ